GDLPPDSEAGMQVSEAFHLTPQPGTPLPGKLPFVESDFATQMEQQAFRQVAAALLDAPPDGAGQGGCSPDDSGGSVLQPAAQAGTARVEAEQAVANLNQLGSLRPLGQLRESFILATGAEGLWIIDQHVAHERVLFEKILRDRQVEKVQRQRLLMPLLVELKPWQMVIFAQIADELEENGFEVEPFGPQTLAIKAAPVGLEGASLERMIIQVIEQSEAPTESALNENLTALRTRIAASIACHSAIKINTPLDPKRMEWLLLELAKTEHPTSCPHGRPIALLYSWKDIQRAFHRI
ncbi:MAG: DNA mismatch repair protein MutL, partial [Terracidiphilus sp.]